MNPKNWLTAKFTHSVAAGVFVLPRARKLATLLSSDGYTGANLTECRRDPQSGEEILIVDVDVGLGQRATVNDVHSHEPVAFRVAPDQPLPSAFSLREDFPQDVPHLNVAPATEPRTFCLYEAQPGEVRITYTALRFIERVRWWLRETAYGRLHGDDQPLDPMFHRMGLSVILPADFVTRPSDAYVATRISERELSPVLLEPSSAGRSERGKGTFAAVSLVTPPIRHGRMRNLPRNLQELLDAYASVGADIRQPLKDLLASFSAQADLLERPLFLIVSVPLLRDEAATQAETTFRQAFFAAGNSAGDIAVKLGALYREGRMWGRPIGQAATGDLTEVSILPVDVHHRFNRALARKTSGKSALPNPPKIILIGCGAMGSQLAMTAARSGYGEWTIVDDDFLLPHNLARHALDVFYIGHAKADGTANEINGMLGGGAARAIVIDATKSAEDPQQWPGPLANTDLIIDASASIKVARWLASDVARTARAASCFLSPNGKDAVVLTEGDHQVPRLDHLEMSYYWRLVTEDALQGHLDRDSSSVSIGACRTPSAKIPQTRVASLAALATEVLCDPWPAGGQIQVWRSSNGGIARHCFDGEIFATGGLHHWTLFVRMSMLDAITAARQGAGKLETGGILAGTWDRDRKIIYVAGHFDPPPDSVHERTGFKRGSVGVHRTIMQVEGITAGNLTYIGEWHTHPPGYVSEPSPDDRHLLRWVYDALQWSDAPAFILIAGDDGFRAVLLDEGKAYSEFLISADVRNP